jgi:hypothetical protein
VTKNQPAIDALDMPAIDDYAVPCWPGTRSKARMSVLCALNALVCGKPGLAGPGTLTHCNLLSTDGELCIERKIRSQLHWEPGYCSRYSDWLRAIRPRGRSSSPGRVKNFLFTKSTRPALRPTQPLTRWVPGALSTRLNQPRREADHTSS